MIILEPLTQTYVIQRILCRNIANTCHLIPAILPLKSRYMGGPIVFKIYFNKGLFKKGTV